MHTDNDAPPAKKPKLSNKNDVSIFAVGSNEFGQLGIDHNVSISIEPCKIAVPDSPDTVKLIGCGFSHTVVVTEKDEIFTCGRNERGQLGLGHILDQVRLTRVEESEVRWRGVKEISCNNHTLLLTEDNKLYTCGENTFGQLGLGHTREQTIFQKVNLDNVAFATTGGNFSAVITSNGNLYSCGQNTFGQLGIGDTQVRELFNLVPIQGRVTRISCGFGHMLILLDNGHVYATGLNHMGQLGLGDTANRSVPQRIATPQSKLVSNITCGYHHTFITTLDGAVYVVGANDYGQLGLGSTAMSIYTFTQILPNAPKIVRIACHLSNATAVVTEDNRLFVTGKNEEGHLCLGHNHDENTFQEVNLPDKEMRKLLLINVGHSHTFFMLGSLFERRPKVERLNYTNPFQDVEIK